MKNAANNASEIATVNEVPSCDAHDGQESQKENMVALTPPSASKSNYVMQLSPRVIRLKDAPGYLGMDRNRFNKEVRPDLTEVPIGLQGIGFDRWELDAWFDEYKERNGRPGRKRGETQCEIYPALDSTENNGSSTSASKDLDAFSRELALVKKRLKQRKSVTTR